MMDFDFTDRSFSFNALEYDVAKIATHCGCRATQMTQGVPIFSLQTGSKKLERIDMCLLDIMFPYSIPEGYLEPTFDTFNTTQLCAYAKFPDIDHVMVAIPWFKGQGFVLEVFRDEYEGILGEIRRAMEAAELPDEAAPELSNRPIVLLLAKYPSQIVELMVRYYCGSAPCTIRGLERLDGNKTYALEELARLGAGPYEYFADGITIPIVEEIEDGVFIFYEENFRSYRDGVVSDLKGDRNVATALG